MYVYGRNPRFNRLRGLCVHAAVAYLEAVTFRKFQQLLQIELPALVPVPIMSTTHPASDDCSSSSAGALPSATLRSGFLVATRRPIHLDPVTETIEKRAPGRPHRRRTD